MANERGELILKAEGEAFRTQRYDLRRVDLVISNYRLLLDHTLPFVVGQQTLSDRLRAQVTYEVEFRHGSLEIVNTLLHSGKPLAAALSLDGGFQLAWAIARLINGVVKFRRAWAALCALADGKGAQPQLTLNVNISDVKQGDNSVLQVNPVILPAADATKGAIDRLVAGIDGSHLSRVSVGNEAANTVLTRKDEEILGTAREELPTTVDIIGKLYEVNFNTRRGWLLTHDGRVPVTWEEAIRPDIKRHADRLNVAFTVRPFVDTRRFKRAPVAYHVLRVWVPQQPLLEAPERPARRIRVRRR